MVNAKELCNHYENLFILIRKIFQNIIKFCFYLFHKILNLNLNSKKNKYIYIYMYVSKYLDIAVLLTPLRLLHDKDERMFAFCTKE